MNKRNPMMIGLGLVALLPVLALAWWFASPLFINKTVDEPFPVASGAVEMEMAGADMDKDDMTDDMDKDDMTADMDKEDMTADMDKEDMMDDMDKEDMMDDMDKEDMMDDMDKEDMTADMDKEDMVDDMDKEDGMMTDEDAPLLVKEGMFRNGGPSYSGSGRAAIYRLPDGSHILRLEDFRVTNGPDLRVLLAAHPDPQTSDALHSQATVELEPLKGNQGNQNYVIPAGVDIAGQWSVVIYCKPFSVIFSVAPLGESG
jgi:hypothetical protein